MAKKIDEKTPTQAARVIGKEEYKRFVSKVEGLQVTSREAGGKVTTAIEKAEADHNLDRWADRVVRQLHKCDPARLSARWKALMLLADHLDIPKRARDIFDKIEKNKAKDAETKATSTKRNPRKRKPKQGDIEDKINETPPLAASEGEQQPTIQ